MNLKQLRYFMAIAEEHQITAAAKKLHIAQPPLSYELSQLEQELGVLLVKRGPRSAELTDAGLLLYKRAEQILAMTTTTTHEVQNYGKGMKGVLSVGAISSSGGLIPNSRMLALADSYPDIRFELHEGNTYAIIDMLEQGIIDLGIVRTPFSDEKYNCRYAEPEPMTAVMTEKYVQNSSMTISLCDLGNSPLIIYRRYETLLYEAFAVQGVKPFIACVNDDARTTYIWARKGFGVGIMPKSILQVLNTDLLVCKDIECDMLYTKLAVIWKKDRYLSPLAQKFISFFESR